MDVGANTISGGALSLALIRNRPQVNGSLSYLSTGWGGSHTLRVGGEYDVDHLIAPNDGYGHPCNCQSTVNNGVPTEVQILLGPERLEERPVDVGRLRGRYVAGQRPADDLAGVAPGSIPAEPPGAGRACGTDVRGDCPGPDVQQLGTSRGSETALTGDGKTVLKLHYGKFWVYPGVNFTSAFNPNPSGWSQTYVWTNDANQNGRWDPGEEGRLTSVSGGSTSTRLDPEIRNTYVHQASAYLEREVARDFGVRTGVVLNARRQPFGTINVSRPLERLLRRQCW